MFNLVNNPETGEAEAIEFRHYGISARQRSINKSIKRLINNKKIPNLARYDDIADFIYSRGGGYSSESEVDDIPESKIVLPEDFQDKKKNTNVALKLHELGPRLKLKLVKIEEGVCRGNVVFHSYVKKSKKEIKEQMDDIRKKRDLKNERKRVQDENVQRKQQEKEAKEQVKEEVKTEFKPCIMDEPEATIKELETAMEALQTKDELEILHGTKRGAEEGEIVESKRANAGQVITAKIAHDDPICQEAFRDTVKHFRTISEKA
jgi:ribosome biogenesis protein SSF1/2